MRPLAPPWYNGLPAYPPGKPIEETAREYDLDASKSYSRAVSSMGLPGGYAGRPLYHGGAKGRTVSSPQGLRFLSAFSRWSKRPTNADVLGVLKPPFFPLFFDQQRKGFNGH